jgi:hypothetical protein
MSGMTAGVITVHGDGTYTIVPAAGPFGVVATSTSLAQAIFEQIYPLLLNTTTFPLATQAQIVDATTTPPTTAKGRTLKSLAAQHNATAAAIVGYVQANAVAHVTSQSLGAVPSSTTHGTPIDAPASPVNVPIQ